MKSILLCALVLGGCTRDNPGADTDDMLGGNGNGDASMMGLDGGEMDLSMMLPDLTPPTPCAVATDCPSGMACDTTSGTCTTACGGFTQTDCHGGCCDGSSCVAGTANDNCGIDGTWCAQCLDGTPTCTNGYCLDDCSASVPCGQGFCCSGGHCAGISDQTCGAGAGGSVCIDCSADLTGHACRVSGVCGCFGASDCPIGKACNLGTHQCGDACSASRPCNGGCCSAASNGTCQAGTAVGACGSTGAVCQSCASASTGHLCEAVSGGGHCGCNGLGDCPGGSTCNTGTHLCTTTCSAANPCNGGCCDIPNGSTTGTCVGGTANGRCGSTGAACVTCGGGTPTCSSGTCSDICGAGGNGTCTGGNCCSSGHCVTGSSKTACGANGACLDCTNSPAGSQCLSMACGCTAVTDCPAANPGLGTAGKACSLLTHTCTDVCNQINETACNGGCCNTGAPLGPRCASGAADNACGQSGVCASCTASCNAGLSCLVSGMTSMCGCKDDSACGGSACSGRDACAVTKTTCCVGQGQTCGGNGECCSGSCTSTKCDGIPGGQSCLGNAALCTSLICTLGNCL